MAVLPQSVINALDKIKLDRFQDPLWNLNTTENGLHLTVFWPQGVQTNKNDRNPTTTSTLTNQHNKKRKVIGPDDLKKYPHIEKLLNNLQKKKRTSKNSSNQNTSQEKLFDLLQHDNFQKNKLLLNLAKNVSFENSNCRRNVACSQNQNITSNNNPTNTYNLALSYLASLNSNTQPIKNFNNRQVLYNQSDHDGNPYNNSFPKIQPQNPNPRKRSRNTYNVSRPRQKKSVASNNNQTQTQNSFKRPLSKTVNNSVIPSTPSPLSVENNLPKFQVKNTSNGNSTSGITSDFSSVSSRSPATNKNTTSNSTSLEISKLVSSLTNSTKTDKNNNNNENSDFFMPNFMKQLMESSNDNVNEKKTMINGKNADVENDSGSGSSSRLEIIEEV